MEHYLIQSIEKALGWTSASALGRQFVRGGFPDADLCARLLTPTRLLDLLMRRSLSPPQLRCFQSGAELRTDQYLTTVVTRRGQSLPMMNMDRLAQLLCSGCTVVLDALDSFEPTMEVACRALQWWSRELVQVNTYLTTTDSSGFSLHWDDHDVVIVQLGGEKSWEVRGPARRVPTFRDAEQNRQPSEEIIWSGVLRSGDVMHIPRGYWHQATRVGHGDGFSLHVTFGFVKRTGVDWLRWLADRSVEEERFRHDLDRWGSPKDQAIEERGLGEAVARLVESYPPARYLTAREEERSPPRHVATLGVFGPTTDVVCVTSFPPRVESHGPTIAVFAAGKKITFAARAEPALRLLLGGHPVNMAETTAATGIDVAVLATTLIKEGVCAELTEALSSGYTGLIPTGNSSNRL